MNDRPEVEELIRVVAEMITDPTGRTLDDLGDASKKIAERIEKLEMENTLMRTALLQIKGMVNAFEKKGHALNELYEIREVAVKALTEVGSVAPKERK